ncbi:hypothetical protein ACLBUZ_27540, partial [Pseudomonas aeruginosa]
MRKDKKQIIGEEISDESIKLFLGVDGGCLRRGGDRNHA